MSRRLLACVVTALWLVAAVPVARADTGDIIEPQNEPPTAENGWQAATCTTDEPTQCSPETPGLFYTIAGGHTPIGFTQYIIQHNEVPVEGLGILKPILEPRVDRTIKTLRVDLPPGLTVNPEATPRCPLALFEFTTEIEGKEVHVPQCPKSTRVGTDYVTLVVNTPNAVPAPSPPFPEGTFLPVGFEIPPSAESGTEVSIYNLEPNAGEPALLGFVVAGEELIFLKTDVAWESDFHEAFTIDEPPPSVPFSTLKNRQVNFGQDAGNIEAAGGNGTFISNPTTCLDPNDWQTLYSTWFRAESYGEPDAEFPNGSTPFEAKVQSSTGELIQQEECDEVPFDPDISVNPGTNQIDSPAPASVVTEMPFEVPSEGGKEQSQSHLRRAEVTLPAGMGLNPSGSNGLVACTDAQFKKGVRTYDNECPADSVIGAAEIVSPPLASPLSGDIYVGEQKSFDPTSGEEFRILIEAKEPEEGVAVRLVGHTAADPVTGRLTTTFYEQKVGPLAGKLPDGLPQAPFESVTLRFDGAKSVLSSPPTCATAESTGKMEPWARPGEKVPVSGKFTLSSDPGGGSCPTTLADRRFAPGYSAKTDNSVAGADTDFRVQIGRGDGEQEVKGVDVTLPEGLTGSLAGLLYCPDVNLEVAEQKTGYQESVNPSCPETSHIGSATTVSGTGSNPVTLGGETYLAGPYKGAPLSLTVITPARSGPFDLGTVVVRVALFVDPRTTEIHAVSDPIPDVFGGVKLDLRSIVVHVDRPGFMRNGTDCSEPLSTRGSIMGGGANPANPAAFSSYDVSAYYRPAECGKLAFKPKLYTRLFGGKAVSTRAKHPRLRAVLEARKGDANIQRTALTMPRALFLDQSNIRTVCTRVQLANYNCPKAAIYGHARARSPLLDGVLWGPVYLVSSNNTLPDLVADLRGQIPVRLYGVISSKRGGIKTVFNGTPDVPVSKFILNMQGGKTKGLLVNSRNLCRGRLNAYLNIKAQNSRRVRTNKQLVRFTACKSQRR